MSDRKNHTLSELLNSKYLLNFNVTKSTNNGT